MSNYDDLIMHLARLEGEIEEFESEIETIELRIQDLQDELQAAQGSLEWAVVAYEEVRSQLADIDDEDD